MKFTITPILAITAGLFAAQTLAKPISSDASFKGIVGRAPQNKNFEDRFSNSGLEYMDWANKMVDEGKMWWPNKTSVTIATRQSGTYTLNGIACGFLGGNEASYSDGEAKFCSLISQYVSGLLLGAEWVVNDIVCQDGDPCLLLTEIGLAVAGGFVQDGVPSVCSAIFQEIYDNCNGNVGGSAQISVSDSSGSQTGYVEAQFYSGRSDTCPAQDDTFVCGTSLGN